MNGWYERKGKEKGRGKGRKGKGEEKGQEGKGLRQSGEDRICGRRQAVQSEVPRRKRRNVGAGRVQNKPWQGKWNGGVLVECVGQPDPELSGQRILKE